MRLELDLLVALDDKSGGMVVVSRFLFHCRIALLIGGAVFGN